MNCSYCNMSTGGEHQPDCPNTEGEEVLWLHPDGVPIVCKPWQCPKCKVVYAPWVRECRCEVPVVIQSGAQACCVTVTSLDDYAEALKAPGIVR